MPQADRDDALALCDENLMNRMLEAGQLTDAEIIPAIARRHVFPCWFGSALKLDGVEELLTGLDRFTRPAPALDTFGAKVFKVSQDEQGARLTWLRVTGGELKVKAQLSGEADGEPWAEKANQLRLYSGTKYTLAETMVIICFKAFALIYKGIRIAGAACDDQLFICLDILEGLNQISNPLLRHQTTEEQYVGVFFQSKMIRDQLCFPNLRPIHAIRDKVRFSSISFLKIVLHSFAQNNDLVRIFRSIFFALVDKLRTKS